MTKQNRESTKVKQLIRIGVFSALWIVVGFLISFTIGFFPPVLLVLPCILAVFGSMIYVVLLSKIEIRGGVFVPAFLLGICLFTMVPYGLLFFFTAGLGLIGEIIYASSGDTKRKMIAVAMPSLGLALGQYIPMGYMQDAFMALMAQQSTGGIGEATMNMMNTPVIIVLVIATIICSFIGYKWGEKIVKNRLSRTEGEI